MDYKYIEQLLERYWNCETSVNEERILRDFFQQEDLESQVPANLMQYKDLFLYEPENKDTKLGADFDKKILSIVEEPKVKAKEMTIVRRLRPLYKAAAVVAIVLTLGNAAQKQFNSSNEDSITGYNYDTYEDTYKDPQVAYEQASSALKMVSDGLRSDILTQEDSIAAATGEKN